MLGICYLATPIYFSFAHPASYLLSTFQHTLHFFYTVRAIGPLPPGGGATLSACHTLGGVGLTPLALGVTLYGVWPCNPHVAILRERTLTPRTRGRTVHRPPPSRYDTARCALSYREDFGRIGRSSREQRVL